MTDNKNKQPKNEEQKSEKIEEPIKEQESYLKEWQKARAELINYKKEEEERMMRVIQFSNERLIKELISVLDSFDLAIQSLENNNQSEEKDKYLKGIYLIKNQLEDIMKKEGLEEILVEKGKVPDLSCEEIVAEVENLEYQPGTIAEIFQRGYKFHNKLIRPVRIAVVKQIKN
jgi:molecular chaperone GrpE